jgi:16S rRNA (cytosine1402-N4)-methyltransferase
MDYQHEPVLLDEVIEYLNPQPGQNFVDGTLGGGGYSLALLAKVGPKGKVLSIDLDKVALEHYQAQVAQAKNALIAHGNFKDIDHITAHHNFGPIHGIVVDIGLSSYQIDQSERGISFQRHELLDMRFDMSHDTVDARFMLNHYSQSQLAQIFREFGEEKFAGKIALSIVKERVHGYLKYTTDLNEIIQKSLPKPVAMRWKDTARRIYQALRIAVNHELDNLRDFLPKAIDLLAPGGRLAVVTFHSLEDRMVKEYFNERQVSCVCPPDFPICTCGTVPDAVVITKKPISATKKELENNPRATSAKLRVIEKK